MKDGLFSIRLRERVPFYDGRIMLLTGEEIEVYSIPARTTLLVLDIMTDGFYVLTSDGRKLIVGTKTLKRAGYVPRG